MSRKWRDSDGPTLLTLVVSGFIMGIVISMMLLQRDKHFLLGIFLTSFGLIAVCGGISANSHGPVRAAFMVFAAIGVGMIAVIIRVM